MNDVIIQTAIEACGERQIDLHTQLHQFTDYAYSFIKESNLGKKGVGGGGGGGEREA